MAWQRTSYVCTLNHEAAQTLLEHTPDTSWSIGLWVRNPSASLTFVCATRMPDATPALSLELAGGSFLVAALLAPNDSLYLEGAEIQPDWNHVMLTYSQGEASLFLNGLLCSQGTFMEPLGPGERLILGDSASGNAIDLAQPALWSRALSPSEVASLYAAGPRQDLRLSSESYLGHTGGPRHWWPGESTYRGWVLDQGERGSTPLVLMGEAKLARESA